MEEQGEEYEKFETILLIDEYTGKSRRLEIFGARSHYLTSLITTRSLSLTLSLSLSVKHAAPSPPSPSFSPSLQKKGFLTQVTTLFPYIDHYCRPFHSLTPFPTHSFSTSPLSPLSRSLPLSLIHTHLSTHHTYTHIPHKLPLYSVIHLFIRRRNE